MIGVFDRIFGGYGARDWRVRGLRIELAAVNVNSASAARLVWSRSCEGILPRFLR